MLCCETQRKDELLLSEHFSEGVRAVRRRLPGVPLRVINFDWHGAVKELRERGAVEGLWALLETLVTQVRKIRVKTWKGHAESPGCRGFRGGDLGHCWRCYCHAEAL